METRLERVATLELEGTVVEKPHHKTLKATAEKFVKLGGKLKVTVQAIVPEKNNYGEPLEADELVVYAQLSTDLKAFMGVHEASSTQELVDLHDSMQAWVEEQQQGRAQAKAQRLRKHAEAKGKAKLAYSAEKAGMELKHKVKAPSPASSAETGTAPSALPAALPAALPTPTPTLYPVVSGDTAVSPLPERPLKRKRAWLSWTWY